ncbi:ATP-binding protein [Proteiniclasticum ruminis]|uniref:ATP-binding protein n=1 Tax=Proteiniclasticum ruminis TaxID=398199 RepID=UPI00289898AA|nr:ATP-binding protein [Proteiniclasticum ruminis]
MMKRSQEYLTRLVHELISMQNESGWFEFKHNNDDPDTIGQYISALSNTAALEGVNNAYIIWGINDTTHKIEGTSFKPHKSKKGNEELEHWLIKGLSPKLYIKFYEISIDSYDVVVLEIQKAENKPIQFKGVEYIRIGSYKKLLKDFPETERKLWRIFDHIVFEEQIAKDSIQEVDVLRYLDYPSYFELLKLPLPADRIKIIEKFREEKIIAKNPSGTWDITNFGALLFGKNLSDFEHLKRKAVRVIQYQGKSRVKTIREQEGSRGYASGFEGLINYINNLLPRNEVIGKALREEVTIYPELAIRELVANALIHQDFSIRGMGPTIEIFEDRMEINNPGTPLVSIERFIDTPPKSRNEAIASFMRRVGVCEERGSGFDKVVSLTEFYQLPAPAIELTDEHIKVILFKYMDFKDMSKDDKIRACYLHACLKYVMRENMTNSSLRERFGLKDKDISTISRIIKDAIAAKRIKASDPDTAPRYLKYVPFWA